jgi:hypothetical protein
MRPLHLPGSINVDVRVNSSPETMFVKVFNSSVFYRLQNAITNRWLEDRATVITTALVVIASVEFARDLDISEPFFSFVDALVRLNILIL